MPTLKISDRDEVLRRVLDDKFAPRFVEIRKKLQVALRAKLAADHPRFVELERDPETRKYLAMTKCQVFFLIDGDEHYRVVAPNYGDRVDAPSGRHRYIDKSSYSVITDSDTSIPISMSSFDTTDRKILSTYRKIWADYVAARDKLSSTLNSYTVREKFVGDFPEFAKYLPGIPAKVNLPAVIVDDVRAELSKLGVM